MAQTGFPSPRRHLVLLVAVGFVACSKDVAPTAEGVRAERATASAVQGLEVRQEEQHFVDVARRAPSFGGYYMAPGGDVVAWVKSSADDESVLGALNGASQALRAEFRGRRLGNIRVQRGRYAFSELAQTRDLLFHSALGVVPGVHKLDLDEVRNRVAVSVEPSKVAEASSAVKQLVLQAGLDTAALALMVEVPASYASRARRLAALPPQGATLSASLDPIVGGAQWNEANQNWCSVGAIVDYNGTRGMVSASHCTSTWFGDDGGTGYQPAGTARAFGVENHDPNGTMCLWWGVNYPCRFSDATFFSSNGTISMPRGLVARTQWRSGPGGTSAGSTYLDTDRPYFLVEGTTGSLSVGAIVQKIGFATGWTWGYVTDTCHDVFDSQYNKIFKCQYESDMYIDGGDSGGSVFQFDELIGDATLAGVISSKNNANGRANFSPWWRVSDEFLGGLQVTRGYSLSAPSVTGSISGTSPVISWPSVPGATKYEVFRQWFVKATGLSGDDNLGFQSSGFVDNGMSVSAYTGTTYPGFYGAGWVAYYVIARTDTDRSVNSTWIYFRLTP